jgi:acyl carrier protein
MTKQEIRDTIVSCLCEVAPEIDPATVKDDVSFRDQFDVDSMDLLNFVIGVHHAFHVDIPEPDYPKLATLHGCVEYLAAFEGTAHKETAR